jgi:NAD(P)-dependent dehydrogenase (short-subunit alcohol dehydrogenase family)
MPFVSSNVLSLAGRNAIVTGASRGLGAQVTLDFAKAGANVLIVSLYYSDWDDTFMLRAQNYTSPSSTVKAEAIVQQIGTINPAAKVGTF